jgi:hypothetical protein
MMKRSACARKIKLFLFDIYLPFGLKISKHTSMKKSTLVKNVLVLISAFAISFQANAQLSVDATATPADMVAAITGGGILVSNISYVGGPQSSGTFSCSGTCNLGVGSGIILTSGYAPLIIGQNDVPNIGFDFSGGGDNDLNMLVFSPTYDASVLEFDFMTVSDTAVFNFVFGSEEYNEYVQSQFNDVFAFFITGPGIIGSQNLALIPGTNIPVAINNVNNGYSVPNVPATGPCTNCAYYQDNTLGTLTTQYDGLTTVLMAIATNLQPGETYHLKIAIADVSDHVYDSGVIIEAGSFTTPAPAWIYADGNRVMSENVLMCIDSSVTLSAPPGFSYLWSTGSTGQSLIVTEEGTYSVQVTGSNPNIPVSSNPVNVVIDQTCSAVTGLNEKFSGTNISFYPNPFNSSCKLVFDNSSKERFTLALVDVTGRTVMQKEITGSETTIERNHLASGIYIYKLANVNGTKTFNGKIAVE